MSFKEDYPAGAVFSARHISYGSGRGFATVALIAAVLVLAAVSIWPMQALPFNHEGGLFETISAAALFSAGIAALWRFPGVSRLYIGLVCLLLAERELESDIYAVDSIPFALLNGLDALLDMTVVRIGLAVVVLGGLAWHGAPNAWRALKQRAPFLMVFVLAGCAAVVAQLLEESSGMFSADLSATMLVRLFVLEETLEMFFSIGILAAVLIGWPKSDREETSHEFKPQLQSDPR